MSKTAIQPGEDLIMKQMIEFNKLICSVQKPDQSLIQQNKDKNEIVYSKLKAQAIDWLLFNMDEIRELALNDTPIDICTWGDGYHSDSLDSFMERAILQSDYHIIIINETRIAICLLQPEEYEIYKMFYSQRMEQKDIAALFRTSTKTIERRVLELREDVFESLRKTGIELDNILAMQRKYRNIT